jgi:hypothetical protein
VQPAVEKAVAELRAAFGDAVRVMQDPDGGAFVIVDGQNIGNGFAPSTSWIGFHITWSCPEADVYPHFIDPAVKYVGSREAPNQFPDGNLPIPCTRNAVMPGFNLPAIQVSRRSNHHNSETDTPFTKLLRVLKELKQK